MSDIVALSGRPKDKLVQLALEVAKAKPQKMQWPMLWSEKLDGNYCIALKHQGTIGIYSRTGEPYTSMKNIESELFNVMDDNTLVIFEAYITDTEQSVISGYCRDTKEQHPELMAMCHDALTLNEFVNGGTTPYIERVHRLIVMKIDELRHCIVVQQYHVDSMEIAMELTKDVWKQGREGGILRNPHGLYAGGIGCPVVGTKRSEDIVKLKQSVTYDLEVIGMNRGKKGKYSETLGTLVCRWKDGKTLPVSGMSDEQRHLWWNDPQSIIGKIIEVKAMTGSTHGSLREARFRSIRYDKSTGDF